MWVTLAILALIAAGGAAWLFWWPAWRRRRIMRQSFPGSWARILERNLPCFRRLETGERQRLEQRVRWFLHRKRFIGCAGLAVSDKMRVTIAGWACLLILNQRGYCYDRLHYIYLYPYAYLAPDTLVDEAGVVSEQIDERLGESWDDGRIVLSWDDVPRRERPGDEARNVVLHEFAHQLDQDSGFADGAPLLPNRAGYRRWARVLSSEYLRLQQQAAWNRQALLDHYGATDPAEFFAVATEHFFEQPEAMHAEHPELYSELQNYYGIDPRRWQ